MKSLRRPVALTLGIALLMAGALLENRYNLLEVAKETAKPWRAGSSGPPPLSLNGDPAMTQTEPVARPKLSSALEFSQWQRERRAQLHKIFRIPGIETPEQTVYRELSRTEIEGGLVRQLIAFQSFDGAEIPAYLFVPKVPASAAAVVVVPGHVKPHESGLRQSAGLVDSYHNQAALRIAEAGFVTLTFELRGFGYLGTPIHSEHRLVAYNALLAGTFYKALIARDIKRAVDLLVGRTEVAPQRIGITGVSYGGEMAVTYGALDTRIKAIVFSAYGGGLGPRPPVSGTRLDQPHYCHLIPGMNQFMHREDMFQLLAPRASLGMLGELSAPTNPAFETSVSQAWSLAGSEPGKNFTFQRLPGGHEFFVEPTIEFFRRHL